MIELIIVLIVFATFFILMKVIAKYERKEKEILDQSIKDETLYDPFTGGTMTYEQVISGHSFINPGDNNGIGSVGPLPEIDYQDLISYIKGRLTEEISTKDLELLFDLVIDFSEKSNLDIQENELLEYLVNHLSDKTNIRFTKELILKVFEKEQEYLNNFHK